MAESALREASYDPAKIAGEMDVAGFAVIENYIGPYELKQAQRFVDAVLRENGDRCLIFRGPAELAGTFMYDLPKRPDFEKLCCDIYEAGTGHQVPAAECYQVLRCLCGVAGQKNSMHFHFDTYVLAALVPITIPTEGKSGDLLLLPNVRKVRHFYMRSLIDKAILASAVRQRGLKRLYETHDERLVRVKMVPGNLYFFWGYKSAHTNEECDVDALRCTALFHYVDPHAGSVLRSIMPTSRLKNIINPARIVKSLSVYR
ncbi:hypothetical protein ACFPL7_12285 [Dongia soli]|uniref:Uncharacterized protein n=1 Tax=Dongia soli TaxID=600628 RepID=A0ABU5EGL9_9PROT|nr:hypothetical protein [Dongia soli]MDY0885154.1 hypothetical protein [Dongia soli]